MLDLEVKMRELGGMKLVKLYRRFRDDSIIVWSGSKGELNEFIEDLNELDEEGKLKFTIEFEKEGKLSFLDANIEIKDSKLFFSMYEKPYSSGVILNFESFQDISIKKSIIAGETNRVYKISDERDQDLGKLKSKLMNNGNASHIIKEVMEGTVRKLRKKKEKNGNMTKEGKKVNYLSINYPGSRRAKALKKLSTKFGFKLAFKRKKTLGNILSKKFKQNTSRKKGLVYSITCECGDEYIGETGKTLEDRLKQHKYAISTWDQNNGPAVHAESCPRGMKWKEAQTLTWEPNWFKRKLIESLWIQRNGPNVNLKEGLTLRGQWNPG